MECTMQFNNYFPEALYAKFSYHYLKNVVLTLVLLSSRL